MFTCECVCFINSLIQLQIFRNEQKEMQNDPNWFCCICDKVTMTDQHSKITQFVKSFYHAYFGIRIRVQDKNFVPQTYCRTCVESLRRWSKGKMKSIHFGVPMMWRERTDHVTDCYFCMTILQGKIIFGSNNNN